MFSHHPLLTHCLLCCFITYLFILFLTHFILYCQPKCKAMQDKEDFLSDLWWLCHLFGIINVKGFANVVSGFYCYFLVGILSSFALLNWNFSGEVNWGMWLNDKVAENCTGNSVLPMSYLTLSLSLPFQFSSLLFLVFRKSKLKASKMWRRKLGNLKSDR